jgi:predicted peptidase
MRIQLSTIAVLILLHSANVTAEPAVSQAHIYKEVKNGKERSIPYRLILPSTIEENVSLPLVIHLHGAGERGTDNNNQLIHLYGKGRALGNVDITKTPYIAFAPQCPNEQQWVNVPWKDGSYKAGEISDALDLALAAMDDVIKTHKIDKTRIYITGLSMGGYGTWDAIQRRPDFFAAAVPICGAGDPSQAKKIAKLPIWVWHGDADDAVPVRGSREMVGAIKGAGGDARYTELEKVGHNSWAPAYASKEMWDWMFAQKRK